MEFEIEFYVTTRPKGNPMNNIVESFVFPVEAANYSAAQLQLFAAMKACNNFQDLMNTLNSVVVAEPQKGNVEEQITQ